MNNPVGESPVLRWTEHVTPHSLWAITTILAMAGGILGFLSISNWRQVALALQVLNLLTILISFAVLLWGTWGGVVSAASASFIACVVTVVAGRWSFQSGIPFPRFPFFIESLLFVLTAYLCVQFLEREQVEETADQRQLEHLEEEYLDLAVHYGKQEELLKVLEKRQERFNQFRVLAARVREHAGSQPEAIQHCLSELGRIVGKGEGGAEVLLFTAQGTVRHVCGSTPAHELAGQDEIDRRLVAQGSALLVGNLPRDVRFTPEFVRTTRVISLVAVPLTSHGKLCGVLRVTSVKPQAFSHEDLRFASEAGAILIPLIGSNT